MVMISVLRDTVLVKHPTVHMQNKGNTAPTKRCGIQIVDSAEQLVESYCN